MTGNSADKIRRKDSKLVSRIYAGALDPSHYNDLFRAWDELFEALVEEDERRQCEDFGWADEYLGHFEQAGKLFDKLAANKERPLAERIDEMPYAVLLCRLDGSVRARNKHVDPAIAEKSGASVQDLVFDPVSASALKSLCQTPHADEGARVVVRLCSADAEEPDIFLAEIVEEISQDNGGSERLLLLRAISAAWSDNVERALAGAFQLTRAEIELIESLYRGLTIKEISQWKGRSQATLRTQLSSILQKTATKSQADLSRIVSGLVQVIQREEASPPAGAFAPKLMKRTRQRTHVVELADETTIEVVESGDLAGTPFYFLQTSSTPNLTPVIVDRLAVRGVRLISPYRSGLGATTRKPVTFTPADWAKCHLEVIERLDVSVSGLGGHRCGGIYAMELARLIGADCKKILLADTGVPLKSARMINQMPAAPKRLFLAARYFPPLLRTPYKLVTSDFYSGGEAENRMVNYFYDGSPVDQEILYAGENWKISRDNIDYCLRNPFQTAQDVTYWSRDTSALMDAVLKHSCVHFFHGRCNLVHRADNIEKFCERVPNATHTIVEGRGQLLIYAEPEAFADQVAMAAGAAPKTAEPPPPH